MEQDNFSELFSKFSQMMDNGEIPDNVKEMLNNFTNNSNSSENSEQYSDNNSNTSSSNNNNGFNFDFETFIKIQNIMKKFNNQNNDPRANLLRSLKPYLKDSRKQKIEQYINMLKMVQIMDFLNKSGGEKQ